MVRSVWHLRTAILVVLASSGLAGCVERVRELTAAERAQLSEYVSQRAPSPSHRMRIRFGDSVELVGYDVSSNRWNRGAALTFTWYWHALKDVEEGFQAFTHVCDATGQRRFGADEEGIVRHLYPVGRFRAGEYVRDVQSITLPDSFDSDKATVYLGVYRGDTRLPITRGPDDGDDRARMVELSTIEGPVTASGAPDVPRLRVLHAATPPSIDGNLAEPEWARAIPTPAFVDTRNGEPVGFGVTARLLWDDANLYVAFEVEDTYLHAPYEHLDDHLWENDCVEIMLNPSGDGRNYFELQASPLGTVFDTRYDTRRVPQPFGHVDWNSGMRVGVKTRGTPNDPSDDQGWVAELAIPFAAFATGTPPATPPQAGTIWRGNFYVMDELRSGMRAAGWSPVRTNDFHVPQRFGELAFEGAP